MEYRVKIKIGWSGKMWYVLQSRFLFFFWMTVHDYESKEEADNTLAALNGNT